MHVDSKFLRSVWEFIIVTMRLLQMSKSASCHEGHVVVVSLLELIWFFIFEWLWFSHDFRQLICGHDYWNILQLLFWMFMFLFDYKSLSFEEKFGIDILVLWIKQFAQATFFTDDEMRRLLAILVFAIKVTSSLFVVD